MTSACSAAGSLAAGAVCSDTQGNSFSISMLDYLAFLEPVASDNPEERRAGAICESAEDWTKKKTTLEVACRILGKRCSYEHKQAIAQMQNQIEMIAP